MKIIYSFFTLMVVVACGSGGSSGNGEASTEQLTVGVFCGELTDADCLSSSASTFETVKFDD